jgi:hypothetical protein
MKNLIQKRRLQAVIRQSWRCYYCGIPTWEKDVEVFAKIHGLPIGAAQKLKCTAEHLIARRDGG